MAQSKRRKMRHQVAKTTRPEMASRLPWFPVKTEPRMSVAYELKKKRAALTVTGCSSLKGSG